MRGFRSMVFVLLASLLCAAGVEAREFAACLKSLRADAVGKGVAARVFDTATAGLEPDPAVLEALDSQPEFTTPVWDYLAGLVDDERIADGRERLKLMASALDAIEREHGVDRHVLVAVWGVETDFGRITGRRELVRSLATLACAGRRQAFFRGEFLAVMQIVQSGEIAPEGLRGSWAGAFGQTQFMPSIYLRLAVDGDGDGRRDIVGTAADALASTANYLKRSGWVSGAPWLLEVRLPAKYAGPSGRRNRQPVAQWTAAGIRLLDGSALPDSGNAALLLPAGPRGPALLTFRNFDAIYSYNASESYALAIAHLADRLRGGAPLATPWPTDDRGLSRIERREVQQRLADLGYDIGAVDGLIGAKTRAAIRELQAKLGLTVDGRAGGKVLDALRARP